MKHLFDPQLKHAGLITSKQEFLERYLDVPRPPAKLLELLNEYVVRHFFVTCLFKSTPEEKAEYEKNGARNTELYNQIISFKYTGSFIMLMYGESLLVNIDPYAESRWERLNISFMLTYNSEDYKPQQINK